MRLASFGHQGRPQAFSIVLSAFLLGIAVGAVVGRCRCQRSTELLKESGRWLMLAGFVDTLILIFSPFALMPSPGSMLLLGVFIMFSAGLKGVIFPIVHHIGSSSDVVSLGRSISRIYVANIAGATLGPLVTGFILLSLLTAGQVFALIAILTMLTGLITAHGLNWFTPPAHLLSACFLVISGQLVWSSFDPLPFVATNNGQGSLLGKMIQNRQGVIHLASTTDGGGSVTYGGNIYDGRTSVDLKRNLNRLDRAYFSAILHPSPRRILIIGLSTGAWTRVVAGLKDVEHIDVVEINPAYLELIRESPEVAPILTDPRIHIHIDDGRRWLRANPGRQYDLIFQNTTFHWRAYTTLLLSAEYFEEIRRHLKPSGIMACNTTGSLDVYFTARKVFQYAVRYDNFVYMSDTALRRRPDALPYMVAAKVGTEPAFSEDFLRSSAIGNALLTSPIESVESYIAARQPTIVPEKIEDMNLLTEMRHGRPNPIPWLRRFLPPNPSP